jgi:23S rRNA (cytidine1920-2'-O)/16S rRNA (cytidine1409-2'-O)-methyltransferase
MRLDEALVARGLAPTRARARDAIRRGCVRVDGLPADKPGRPVGNAQALAVEDPALRYVSRGALKLLAGLDAFGLSPMDRIALDLGASTGGFVQVLLERGARRVYAVDVGHGQLHPTVAADPRVIALEGRNARELTRADVPEPVEAVTADLSFISLRTALPGALALAAAGAWGLFLVKPQFEVGRENLGKGGILRDAGTAERAAREVADWLRRQPGWHVLDLAPSPIMGGEGNREFLLGARRD